MTRDKLPSEVRFDKEKKSDFTWNVAAMGEETYVDSWRDMIQSWKNLEDFAQLLRRYDTKETPIGNVMQSWNTDDMFGYQFLNGCNPVMIRKCVELPDKFPVTHEMVKGSLQRGLTLQEEIKAGNIYIADYEILNYLEANKTDKWQYYLTAPICLLYKNRLDQIVPIAIQLRQTPGGKKTIFLPDDKKYDWMLAKMWVKSSDFNLHELSTHLFKTHLISEVFEIAMYRQLSTVHPVYKLLIPHVRFTMAINAEARDKLIHEENGIYRKISSISADGINTLMKRAMKALTYKSLCFPEEIRARGMEDAPKYYYRDDGMRIWEAIKSFITDLVKIYYDSDEAVKKDVEIQAFVEDVCQGLRGHKEFPRSLNTRAELIEYLTAMIFNASAQHAAVNFGQYDWYGWIPNSPSCMRKPPPKQKGQVNLKYIMDTLPDSDCSRVVLGIVWTLSQFQRNELYLVTDKIYKHFTEQPVKEAIKTFQEKLGEVEDRIKCRNEKLPIPYGLRTQAEAVILTLVHCECEDCVFVSNHILGREKSPVYEEPSGGVGRPFHTSYRSRAKGSYRCRTVSIDCWKVKASGSSPFNHHQAWSQVQTIPHFHCCYCTNPASGQPPIGCSTTFIPSIGIPTFISPRHWNMSVLILRSVDVLYTVPLGKDAGAVDGETRRKEKRGAALRPGVSVGGYQRIVIIPVEGELTCKVGPPVRQQSPIPIPSVGSGRSYLRDCVTRSEEGRRALVHVTLYLCLDYLICGLNPSCSPVWPEEDARDLKGREKKQTSQTREEEGATDSRDPSGKES
nr:polyunsaturated fatty acid 5-lipoxygenase-like [Misgurnus anguillicaudatus]